MTKTLNVVPEADEISTGVHDAEKVANGLADVLADTYRLIFKTHAYHWTVTGPAFYSIHKLNVHRRRYTCRTHPCTWATGTAQDERHDGKIARR